MGAIPSISAGPIPCAEIILATAKATFPTASTTVTAIAAFATTPTITAKTAAATTITPKSAAATTLAVFHGTGFVNDDIAGTHAATVEFLNRGLGFRVGGHFHKAKTLRSSGDFIRNYFRAFHSPTGREKLLQLCVGHLKWKASNI